MKIPEQTITIQALIDQAHEERADPPRGHLGASILGDPCDRKLWLSFRWAVREKFKGRILRLFRRGHNEESTIVSDLRAIGVDIQNTVGEQTRVDFGSHVSGSLDGIIESGVPGALKTRHIAEFKTHSKKSFDDVEKQGVQKSKPLHYVQMQVYMHGTGIDRALYLAVCKDDDRIYTERVKYDKDLAEKAIKRAHRIALAERMPEPLSTRADWFECKFCTAHDFCHNTKTTKQVNCRTCAHATPAPESTWHCAKWDDVIPLASQNEGCDSHVMHPDLVPWKRFDSPDGLTAIYEIDGHKVTNGTPADGVYATTELLAHGGDIKILEAKRGEEQWVTF